MKTIYELNEKDIVSIVSEKFEIGTECVHISYDSKEDDSFKVATSDDASIAVSFQMSYRYDPETVIDTYKKFKGMGDGSPWCRKFRCTVDNCKKYECISYEEEAISVIPLVLHQLKTFYLKPMICL